MSILHICCNLAGSTVFPELFEALKAHGLEQAVFVPEKRESDMGKNLPDGVETHYALTVKKTDALFFFRKAQRSVPAIEKTVDMKRITLVHAHTLFTDGSIAHKLCRKHGIPYVVTLRYSDIEAIWRYEPHLRPLARRILRDASRVIFLSSAAKEKVLSSWLTEADRKRIEPKTAIIPNGIRPQWLDGKAREELHAPVRVGFAGLLNPRKRPLDALAAVHAASDAGGMKYVFTSCGSGELEAQLLAAMREGDSHAGRVQGMEAMKRFYAQCDLLLVPSSAETFGMVYLEAMSQGIPVLYTKGQGFDGQFPEGEVGYAVVCGDVAQQAQMIAKAAEDYPARSRRCIERANAYAWPVIASRWAKLYRSI
ncbi:MAG: glycosyltransferase family 4 protein [Clostridia bacterium]|nr:glycosyltransferase family 4 protein [Clostridia bacterium]